MRYPCWPGEFREPPTLDARFQPAAVEQRCALLANPFYPEDPHASFGKHVLTPTLALTSIAAATPPDWRVRYWDENLLRGPPPVRPFPQVVGITDNNPGSDRQYPRRLCGAPRPLKIIWSAAVSVDVSDDPLLVREVALAGCTGVFVGFESLNDGNLADSKKRTPPARDYARRVRLFQENGIQVNGSFVLGFDHDRGDVFQKTAQWIEDNRLECATFHILTPYPATPLFRQMQAEGRLLHTDWDLYDTARAVFQPKHMSPQELEEGYAWCYRRVFSHASIWKRRPPGIGAAAGYPAMSYLYRRAAWLWRVLIRHRLVEAAWRLLVAYSRWRHLTFRERLAAAGASPEERESMRGDIRPAAGAVPVVAGL